AGEKEADELEIGEREDLGGGPQGVADARSGKEQGAQGRGGPHAAREAVRVPAARRSLPGGRPPDPPKKGWRCQQQRQGDEMDCLKKRVPHSRSGLRLPLEPPRLPAAP